MVVPGVAHPATLAAKVPVVRLLNFEGRVSLIAVDKLLFGETHRGLIAQCSDRAFKDRGGSECPAGAARALVFHWGHMPKLGMVHARCLKHSTFFLVLLSSHCERLGMSALLDILRQAKQGLKLFFIEVGEGVVGQLESVLFTLVFTVSERDVVVSSLPILLTSVELILRLVTLAVLRSVVREAGQVFLGELARGAGPASGLRLDLGSAGGHRCVTVRRDKGGEKRKGDRLNNHNLKIIHVSNKKFQFAMCVALPN